MVVVSGAAARMAGGSVRRIEDGALAQEGIAAIRVDPAAVAEAMALYEALVSPEGGGGAGGFRRSSPTKAPRSSISRQPPHDGELDNHPWIINHQS